MLDEVITGGGGRGVAVAATALAELLHARVRSLAVADPPAETLLAELDSPHTLACVLGCSPDPDAACWSVAAGADKPVVLVPPAVRTVRPHIARVLLPLDGTPESADAVRDVAALFDHAGTELLVLHVFDANGRARTVRESVLHAAAPVLLLPVHADHPSRIAERQRHV